LFEETQILLSSDHLTVFRTYDVANGDMRYNYTVLIHECTPKPKIDIDRSTHISFGWFTIDDALRLPLVPQLEPILNEVVDACREEEQLVLFQAPRPDAKESILLLEEEVLRSTNSWPPSPQAKPQKTWQVSFGLPGAGKTTTLREMHKQNPNCAFVTDETILRPSSRLNHYLIEAFEHDNKLYFFRFQMEVLAMRWQQAMSAPDKSLVDETIFSTLAYSRALYYLGWISKTEYQTFFVHYLHYRDLLPAPTRILQFTCEIETLKRRIRSRPGRRREQCFTAAYLHALERSFAEVASDLKSKFHVVPIDTTRMPTEEIVTRYGL
jgi:deoxyadenosine/deoxycytidine kinase